MGGCFVLDLSLLRQHMHHDMTRYHQAIRYLEGLSNIPEEKDYMRGYTDPALFLERMRSFLGLLHHPERGFKIIHITGTAGKGTVTTMLHEILHCAGKRVGSFTSPFSTTAIEKIRVGTDLIPPEEFADIVDSLKPHIDHAYLAGPYGKPSYFEIFLAIGFLYFKKTNCDWVVLEVGAGGRFDATNVIEDPVVTAITNIDYDHTDLLGKTLQKIAWDKAGIIKPGGMFFTAEQRPRLRKMFRDICAQQGTSYHSIGHQDGYQAYNRALAGTIATALNIAPLHIETGIARAHLPCRFEIMQQHPTVVLDGAHNKVKIASTVENLGQMTFKKLILVLGISDNKDHLAMLQQIVPLAHTVVFTRFQIKERKCAHPKILWEESKPYLRANTHVQIFLDPSQALALALKEAGPQDLVLVTGSFFLVGDVRTHWIPEQRILSTQQSV